MKSTYALLHVMIENTTWDLSVTNIIIEELNGTKKKKKGDTLRKD